MKKEIKISKLKKIHNNKYDYLLDSFTNNSKIKIICPIHGEFEQSYIIHLRGCGCPKCAGNYRYTQEEIIERFKITHNYFYIYNDIKYKNMDSNVEIICPIHGVFYQNAYHHLKGSKCPKCAGVNKYTTEDYIKKVEIVHYYKYDYSLTDYKNNHTKIKIICPIHNVFEQYPKHHLNGSECPKCKNSKGEKYIFNILKEHNIKFTTQKTFDGCKDKKLLQFDFYLPYYNICIEFDGIQHFQPIKRFGGEESLKLNILRDKIKNEYCKQNNIKLIRIRYDENIDEKLSFLFV